MQSIGVFIVNTQTNYFQDALLEWVIRVITWVKCQIFGLLHGVLLFLPNQS